MTALPPPDPLLARASSFDFLVALIRSKVSLGFASLLPPLHVDLALPSTRLCSALFCRNRLPRYQNEETKTLCDMLHAVKMLALSNKCLWYQRSTNSIHAVKIVGLKCRQCLTEDCRLLHCCCAAWFVVQHGRAYQYPFQSFQPMHLEPRTTWYHGYAVVYRRDEFETNNTYFLQSEINRLFSRTSCPPSIGTKSTMPSKKEMPKKPRNSSSKCPDYLRKGSSRESLLYMSIIWFWKHGSGRNLQKHHNEPNRF